MEIINLKLKEIKPYDKNPRFNDEAAEYVANSIKEFGFKNPIILDKNKVIIAGHTRLKAAELLELETAPCIIAEDLTKEQVKAFRLADNKVGEIAEWDEELLAFELEGLVDLDFGMSEFGFDDHSKYEGDIDDIFFESFKQAVKDSTEYLKWGTSKAWLSEDGSRLLDDLYKKYKIAVTNEEIEFVQWLLNR